MEPWLKPCVYLVELAPPDAPWLVLPSGKGIPWHRVVGERGKILIRGPYAMLQKKLLESEGVKLIESRVDLKLHAWKPPATIGATGKHTTAKSRKTQPRRRPRS